MNRHERDQLLQFLGPLLRARAHEKDFAAETLILGHCARQPDALYLLVQRAMALESALQAAQTRIADLQGSLPTSEASQDSDRAAPQARPASGDRSGAWGRGLLAQTSVLGAGVGLGVAAGVVAGGLLLDTAEDWLGGDL
jgi:hypothetical protein